MSTRSAPAAVAAILVALGCGDPESSAGPGIALHEAASAVATLAFRQVSAGEFHTCGVTTGDIAYCWGANGGTLGDGTTEDRARPAPVLGGLRFRQVSAGGSQHTCGVTTDRRAYCWGLNNQGQLGDGTTVLRTAPVPVAGGREFRQVTAGQGYTCGITYPDNRAYCWGRNDYGQLGVGDEIDRWTPTAVHGGRRFRQISASLWFAGHTCAVTTANQVYCWGSNREGQLGDSTAAKRRVRPVLVVGGRQFDQVAAGTRHTCAVTTGARAFCWGRGVDGELGTGDTHSSSWPRRVARGLSLAQVSAGLNRSCGMAIGGQVYCWGSGPLGDGSGKVQLKPVPVGGGLLFSQLGAGESHTCGTTTAAAAYCWGSNLWGQLGDGTNTERPTPTRVADPM